MDTKKIKKDTISIYFVHEALVTLHQRGLDTTDILLRAGIAPALLQQPQARVSAAQFGALWHVLVEVLDDEFFGLDSHPMKAGSFTLLGHAIIHCATLEQALHRILRFLRLVLDDLHGELRSHDGHASLTIKDMAARGTVAEPAPKRAFAYGTFMIMVYGIACWLTGRRIPLLKGSFRCAEPSSLHEWRVLFCQNLHFDQEYTRFVFPAEYLHMRNIQDERSLKAFLREAPANFLVKYKNRTSISARLRRHLKAMAPSEWPGFAELAERFNYSAATLRRKLNAEGTSFRTIAAELRHAKAIELLAKGQPSITEIAAVLGFAEPSGFNRAFRQWTGMSPSDYRHTALLRSL